MDKDDPEQRIAELERQLANEMNGVIPRNQDPGGTAFHRYRRGRKWTSATDESTQPPFNVDAATTEDEPEASQGRDPVAGKPLSDKRAAIAGVLQLAFGVFGAGRFYIGSKAIGGCQLGLTIVGFVLTGVIPDSADTAVTFVGLLLIAVVIWAFIDAILMFARVVTDGQGRKLR